MVDTAIGKLKAEQPGFVVYTVCIWTDPDAGVSSISFEDEEHSLLTVEESYQSRKQIYDTHKDYLEQQFGQEYIQLLLSKGTRNDNAADFRLRDYIEITNASISNLLWQKLEDKEEGWRQLTPRLHEIAEYALEKIQSLPLHEDFELAVNGSKDWYEFTWKIRKG